VLTAFLNTAMNMYAKHAGLGDELDEGEKSKMIVHPPSQHKLSSRIERENRTSLHVLSSVVDRIRLDSLRAPRTAAWLLAGPSRGPIDLTLSPDEMQMATMHRLGLPLARAGDTCPLCSKHVELDKLGHHQLTCSTGGFVVSRHNRLRDALFSICAVANLGPKKEQGSFHEDKSRPADLLVPDWSLGKPAAFDFTVASPLVPMNIQAAGGIDVVSKAAEFKHNKNDPKCTELGWVCIPLSVDLYGRWGDEAHQSFAEIASRLAVQKRLSNASALTSIYNHLGIVLARQNARALLARRVTLVPNVGARELGLSST
jgi:hypothetical protein